MATQSIQLKPRNANLFSTGQPALYLENGTNIPYSGYGFDASTAEQIFFDFKVPFYLSGNLTITVRGYSQTGQTTGAVVMGAQIAALSAGDAQSVLTDALATANTATATINSTARGSTEVAITVTNLDSIAADDTVQLRLYRDATAGGDTLTGDFIVFDVEVEYAATGGIGAGDFNGPASATDNAIVRFDLTTGKVGQNSVVTVDDSGNIAGAGTYNGVTVDKVASVVELSSAQTPASTTLANITGLSISLPRAGTYWIEGMLDASVAATATTAFGLNVSANFTRMSVAWNNVLTTTTQIVGQQTSSLAAGGAGVASGSRSVTTRLPVNFSGSITVSGAATVQLLASRSTSTLTINAGSAMNIREA